MFKISVDGLLQHPLHTSLFVADFLLLLFLPLIRPPIILCALMLAGLVYLSLFFGAKFVAPEQQH